MPNASQQVSVTQKKHGLFAGRELYSFVLKNESIEIEITNLGGIILSVCMPDRNGIIKNVVAGFATIEEYKNNLHYLGCVVGRYANRIANGRFSIDGIEYHLPVNNGANNLHGGNTGFDKKVWQVERLIRDKTMAGVVLSYLSKDGEEGFPGNLSVSLIYLLTDDNELQIHYLATTDKATPVSLTNHSYFNLTGFENNSVLNHSLAVYSDEYTEKNEHNQPTGNFINVADTVFDFRVLKSIGKDIQLDELKNDGGYDHNFVLKHTNSDECLRAATLTDEETGRSIDVFTTAPGIQVYTANFFDGSVCGAQGICYQKHSAVALETQAFPDSPNQPAFPDTILRPGEEYRSTTKYVFGVTG